MGRGIAFLFGGTFGAVGVAAFAMMAHGIWLWYESSSWHQVPANIIALELKASHGDSTTYKVICTYDYEFDQRKFTGDRPSLYGMSDNIGSFHQNLHRRLKADRRAGQVTCLVDPDQPQRSLLDRSYRPGMLGFELVFVIAFGSVGLSILATSFGTRRDREVRGRLRICSSKRGLRSCAKVMCLYHTLIVVLALPVSLYLLLSGYFSALLPLVLSLAAASAAFVGFRYAMQTQPVTGALLLPDRHGRKADTATLLLPASWQGPVDMEARWSIPATPSNRVGVEDQTGSAEYIELPAVGGTTQQTEIELPIPEIPERPAGDQPIQLEIIGTIGGYRYQDQFELKDQALQWLYDIGVAK